MAFKIKDELDLSGFAITKFCIDAQTELPTSGTIGTGRKLFYTGNGDFNNRELVYDGSSWKALAFLDEITNNEVIESLGTRVTNLESALGSDLTGYIDTWTEVKDFLSSIPDSEDYDLMGVLNAKANASDLANYLPLSGGTITGDTDALKILRNSEGYSAISYYNTQNGAATLLGVMGFDSNGEPSVYRSFDNTWRTILHSGNIVEQINDLNNGTPWRFFDGTYQASNMPESAYYYLTGITLAIGGNADYKKQIGFDNFGRIFSRSMEGGTWKDWKTIAFTDSDITGNAATATIAEAARTLLSAENTNLFFTYPDLMSWSLGHFSYHGYIDAEDIAFRYGNSYTTAMLINSSGNVTIGSSDLAGSAKLYVDGSIRLNGSIEDSDGIGHYDSGTGYFVGLRRAGLEVTTGGLLLLTYGATPISFYTGGEERMHIAGSGNVLIGATEDDESGAKLQVNGRVLVGSTSHNDVSIIIKNSHNTFYLGQDRQGGYLYNPTLGYIMQWGMSEKSTTIHGDLHVSGNIIADGEVSAGGAGEEGTGGGGGAFYQTTFTPSSSTSVTITHGLRTEDIVITLYEQDSESGRWSMCLTDIEIVDDDNIIINFGSTSSIVHKVVIMGASA